jgi:hypothetical protein
VGRTVNPALLARLAKNHRSAGPPIDPYWDDVTSLLHFDSSQGSTDFVDQISVNDWAIVGNSSGAYIDTSKYKFGGSSLFLNANAGIQSAGSVLTNGATATLEAWFYNTGAHSSYGSIFAVNENYGLYTYNGGLQCFTSNSTLSAASYPTSQWNHVALVFNAGVGTLYLNGVSQHTGSGDWITGRLYIGADDADEYYAGWIDDFRVTSGVARYTSNFTPPTAPFPNS